MKQDASATTHSKKNNQLAKQILWAMFLGIITGLILYKMPSNALVNTYLVDGALHILGKAFIAILTMLVVPIVFVSLVCGTTHLDNVKTFGRLATKTLVLYLLTTTLAITLGLTCATIVKVGSGSQLTLPDTFSGVTPPSFQETLLNIIPSNPFAAMAQGNVLQIIIFAILFGSAIALSGKAGKNIADLFDNLNTIIMRLIMMIMRVAPFGVFCLIASLFARLGFSLILQLIGYFTTVLFVLLFQLFIIYPLFLKLLAGINPIQFFRKLYAAMIFAFSISSSNASIPVVLNTVENKLGVDNSIASFVIPLGATINMDGTAIMQGIATVFIANAYQIHLGLTAYLMVVLTATLSSIGTAGVPSVGLITLTLVLKQVGLPVEGIAMIIGIDRLLDMVRTAVNISGDAMVACVVAKSEKALDEARLNAE